MAIAGERRESEARDRKGCSGGSADARDLGPDRKCAALGRPVLIGGDMMAAEMKEVVDRLVRGKELLCLAR